jgi:hypothetical protein
MTQIENLSTPAKRSWDNVIQLGMGALLFFGLSAGLFSDDHIVLALILLLAALGTSYAAFRGSFEAACPICGQPIDELSEGHPQRCPNCFGYSVLSQGQFCQLDPTTVKYGPFSIPLPPNPKMPQLCCGCASPATKKKHVTQTEVNLASFAALPAPWNVRAYNLDVPVCDAHDPIVILRAEGTKNSIGLRRIGIFDHEPTALNPGLFTAMQVPSYRFYWEFIRLNRMNEV